MELIPDNSGRADLIIRHMNLADADSLNHLITTTISSLTYYNEIARKSEIEKYSTPLLVELMEEDAHAVLVALCNNMLAGFCLTGFDDGLIWLSWIGVHPDFRRRGIAQKLLLKMEQTVQKRGAHKIWCDCRTVNEPSKQLLAAVGYRQVCTVENHWYGQDFILWDKPIAPK